MGSATWTGGAASGDWNTAGNWDTNAVPTDTATFAESTQTQISFSSAAEVGEIVFASGAPIYQFVFGTALQPALTITGGVTNRSDNPQHFTVKATGSSYKTPELAFSDAASAGGRYVSYYSGPVDMKTGSGGGNITFDGTSTAGEAAFVVTSGAHYTSGQVGAEVTFRGTATAGSAAFVIYGGTDPAIATNPKAYGFGNVVFHEQSNAGSATFLIKGGTIPKNDGGNAQFYGNASAAHGSYRNEGGTRPEANGGDTAFDGTGDGGDGRFVNLPGTCEGAYGGSTSFNNNPNWSDPGTGAGASAGRGEYYNHGGAVGEGKGGNTKFTAAYFSPTGANGTFRNYGTDQESSSGAGYTRLSKQSGKEFFPTAGNGTFWNYPAPSSAGYPGHTDFRVWTDGADEPAGADENGRVPTAEDGVFYNCGASVAGAAGGYTEFRETTSAGNATLIGFSGARGGYGGTIKFGDASTGDSATVALAGNGTLVEDGTLDVADHTGSLRLRSLECHGGGTVALSVGTAPTTLELQRLQLNASIHFRFSAGDGFLPNTPYTVLTAPDLSSYELHRFSGSMEGPTPTFSISGNDLQVTFDVGVGDG